MNIAYSIPFYFNFGKGHYFVLRVKQHIFGKAQIFQMNRVNPAIINWREKKVETCARLSTSFENFLEGLNGVMALFSNFGEDLLSC